MDQTFRDKNGKVGRKSGERPKQQSVAPSQHCLPSSLARVPEPTHAIAAENDVKDKDFFTEFVIHNVTMVNEKEYD